MFSGFNTFSLLLVYLKKNTFIESDYSRIYSAGDVRLLKGCHAHGYRLLYHSLL